jgi:hypothetical protein
MYYSYVEIEYVAMSFSPARTDLALKLLNIGVYHLMIHYLFFELEPPIKLSRQPNMCFSKPVPLTGNISAGTDPSNPYFRSPKGTFSKALEMFFYINLLNHPQFNLLVSIPLM